MVLFHQKRSETLSVLKQYRTIIELELNKKNRALQTDVGRVGITCPNAHHRNVVEHSQKHRHIVKIGLSLLPFILLINHLLSHEGMNPKFPYKHCFCITADYTFLKVFGCAYFPLFLDLITLVNCNIGLSCTFLGYSLCHKG